MPWILTFLICLQLPDISLSSDGTVGEDSGNYCGIYAAFGAVSAELAKVGEKPRISFDELLSGDFVSSFSGSTQQDLERAVRALGCNAKTFSYLSLRTLESTNSPLILHVSERGRLGLYRHWILFLGMRNGLAIVRNGDGGDVAMSPSELLSSWDGVGIAISRISEPMPSFFGWEVMAICVLLTGITVIVLVASKLALGAARSSRILICATASVAAVLYSFSVNPHVLMDRQQSAALDLMVGNRKLPAVDFEMAEKLLTRPNVVFVDCRYSTDFADGAIEKAINVPIDLPQAHLQRTLRDFDREAPLVLYCQSKRCKFADIMSVELTKLGFKDLTIYRNGYAEWASRVGSNE